eukprot:scaffold317_cov260-Pinguiococcus_pyrenoidosus.AAC.44
MRTSRTRRALRSDSGVSGEGARGKSGATPTFYSVSSFEKTRKEFCNASLRMAQLSQYSKIWKLCRSPMAKWIQHRLSSADIEFMYNTFKNTNLRAKSRWVAEWLRFHLFVIRAPVRDLQPARPLPLLSISYLYSTEPSMTSLLPGTRSLRRGYNREQEREKYNEKYRTAMRNGR